ncbi:uncharacterized protein LOC119161800 isoform X3 [Rhipicephalus microplus]|uniref:uncharacterized protein LOC119161800 isoform X3 n=1 Tax=Rhipicephalus microplus TaxID=6941 RepID=UPI003F6CDA70
MQACFSGLLTNFDPSERYCLYGPRLRLGFIFLSSDDRAVVAVFGAGFESWPQGHNSDSKEICSAASIDGAFNEFLWWTTHQQLLGAAAQCREALCRSAGIGVKTCPAAVIDTCLRLHLDASRVPHVTDGGVDHHQGCSSYDEKLLRLLLQLGPSCSSADMRTAHLRPLFLQAVVAVFGAGFESWPPGHNSDSKEMCSAASIDGAFNEFLWWTTHQQLLGAAAQCREALCGSAGIGVKTCPAAVIDTCLRLHLDASRVPHETDGGVDHHQGCSSYDEKLLRLLLQLGPSCSGADMRTAHLRLLFLQDFNPHQGDQRTRRKT